MSKEERLGQLHKCVSVLFLLILAIYPFRHIMYGVDLWDAGYNYSNFKYTGVEHMDSMWYFATWLSNLCGSFLNRLPFAGTMVGMNFYTAIIVSLLATAGFLFCTKSVQMPEWLAFIGEITAISACFLPTAVLYNYLTFLLFLGALASLYQGLTQEKEVRLVLAGILLGLNFGVKFSNIVQVGMILAVWWYSYLKKEDAKKAWHKTLLCAASYLATVFVLLGFMGASGGVDKYLESISGLFSMSEQSEEYRISRMLGGLWLHFLDNLYWIKRFLLYIGISVAGWFAIPKSKVIWKHLWCVTVAVAFFLWLLLHRFSYPDFATYQSVYAPGVMLLGIEILLAVVIMADRKQEDRDRLLAAMTILTLLLTSMGGNNGFFYCMNNMFFTFPVFLHLLGRLWIVRQNTFLHPLISVSTGLAALNTVLLFTFGVLFVYEEAAGARDMTAVITEIPALKGMHTGADKKAQLEDLYGYLREENLLNKKVILYGQIPGVSYYMGMEPAMNVWSDLDSYPANRMTEKLSDVSFTEAPVVILTSDWAGYFEDESERNPLWTEPMLKKGEILQDFMSVSGYEAVFSNERYVLYTKSPE